MLRIVCTGPESTGKTTLSQQLARHYECPWVAEYARSYIEGLDRSYTEADLLAIAEGQIELENLLVEPELPLIVCDTDLLTIRIWSEYKYGRCDEWILEQFVLRPADLYLLCAPDIPWTPDPQRENPEDRQELYGLYKFQLVSNNRRLVEVFGDETLRFHEATTAIDQLLDKQ
ncbi:MAG: ATP-binding protein [Bacteroidota bacterium]